MLTSATMTKTLGRGNMFESPVDDEYSKVLRIQFNHQSEEYIEIRNSRATTFEELFGQVVGWIGVILGYSLLQIPDFLLMSFNALKRIQIRIQINVIKRNSNI